MLVGVGSDLLPVAAGTNNAPQLRHLEDSTVRKQILFVFAVCLFFASAFAWTEAQPSQTKPAPAPAPMSVDEVLKAVRADLQTGRADIVAKNITLTSEQAAKFWPVFERYQKEQNEIMDAQMKDIQAYVDKYNTLDDATSLSQIGRAHV